jgi:geranylgeranyl transferase type-2 subunit beta
MTTLCREKHIHFILKLLQRGLISSKTPVEPLPYLSLLEEWCMEPLHMSALYWAVTALHLLVNSLDDALMQVHLSRKILLGWIWTCYQSEGGFGGSPGHDAHLLHTLSAVQLLILLDGELTTEIRINLRDYIFRLEDSSGAYRGDLWGEIDTRFSYCAISCLWLLNELSAEQALRATTYVFRECRNFDTGFGSLPNSETHAGQIFCCIGVWKIAQRVVSIEQLQSCCGPLYTEKLAWWLAERQLTITGGLNGRPEKLEDVCYSWWVLASLAMLDRLHWIDTDRVIHFILSCQDDNEGGFSDRKDNLPDMYHTLFALAGLSLLAYNDFPPSLIETIDPIFCLPVTSLNKKLYKPA